VATDAFAVEIDSLDQEGRGVGRRDGKAVFVEGALPGERVHYERRRNKPNYEVGRVLSIERPAVARVVPRCPHAGLHPGACGGCSMQHVDARVQVAIKQRVLEDTLWHLGRVRPETVLRPVTGEAWRYRHRARFSVRHVVKKGTVLVGFHERASSYVADIRQCEIVPRHVSDLLLPLRDLVGALSLRERLPQIELAVGDRAGALATVLVMRVLQPPIPEDVALLRAFGERHAVDIWLQSKGPETATPLDAEGDHELALALPEFGVRLPFGPTDFTQVNHAINEILVRRAVRLLAPAPDERVADFFCGLGNFTLPLARRAAHVVGIEGSAALVNRAQRAARANFLAERSSFEVGNLAQWSPPDWTRLNRQHGTIDKVLIDPPREGALQVVEALLTSAPRRLVYVSCNPATLARDCAVLVHRGGWSLAAAGIVNMFPHTSHVESIAVLEPPVAANGAQFG
jgi:23S rRNA (uracil1939-C5)-methyltransferase